MSFAQSPPGQPGLFGETADFPARSGLVSRKSIESMIRRRWIQAVTDIEEGQLQPASLDLRLGAKAYRVRASFLPGKTRSVQDGLEVLSSDPISLEHDGAVLEKGCVYVVPLMEYVRLPDSVSAFANPKSSTGRLDIFTRLITDRSEVFDQVERGYQGPLYAEISPRSFSIRVRSGSKLNQIRFRRWNPQQFSKWDFAVSDKELNERNDKSRLVDGKLDLRGGGLILRIALNSEALGPIIGYRAQKHTDVIDVDSIAHYQVLDFWEPIAARPDRHLILDPGEFYILASQERVHIPPDLAAEMDPIDPAMGEFRVHYAGFFDPGFGWTPAGDPGSRAVLEVRSHEVPFILEDGQVHRPSCLMSTWRKRRRFFTAKAAYRIIRGRGSSSRNIS